MSLLEVCALAALGLLALEQVGASLVFALYCHHRLWRPIALHTPKALVVLSLRGADHRLAECLQGILQQDYPDYLVRIVIDSRSDPAAEVVNRALAALPSDAAARVQVQFLREKRLTCSLKCSSVYEGTEDLPADCQVIATIDSDIVPHSHWLRDLVAPLANSQVGATMGNRWYAPTDGGWGSIVCYLWNAPVVVSMFFCRIPWGGTLAVDAQILRNTDLRERWLKAGCEDIPLFAILLRIGLRLEFVPTLLMVSSEECSLAGCLRFINRQFVWTRLYHPLAWSCGALLYGIASAALALTLALAISRAVRSDVLPAAILVGAVAAFFTVEAAMLTVLELTARRMLAARGMAGCPFRMKTFVGILFAQALTPVLLVRSLLTQRIDWRGIEYEIRGPWKIRMVEYRPYRTPATAVPAADGQADEVTFPNLLSRVFLKREFERQFIIPPPPPWLLERFLNYYEQRWLQPDVASIAIDRPIFLVGLHRSGTTLLQDLLCLHPQLAYINNAMPSFRRCFCAAEHFRQRLKLDFRGQRKLGDSVEITAGSPNEGVAFWREWLAEDHHDLAWTGLTAADLSPQQLDQLRQSIKKIIWCFGGQATRFFCKNPSLLPHLQLLADLFPDARFVHIVRDARTCANSMVKLYRREQAQLDRIRATGGHGIYDTKPYVAFPRLPRLAEYVEQFGADSIETTARLWNDALAEVERVKPHLPSFHEVRYEDILEDPDREVARIIDFCELPPFESGNEAYWRKLATVGQLQHTNRYADFERIEAICGEKLSQYGYLGGPAPVADSAAEAALLAATYNAHRS